MSKWFYTNESGEKIEITGGQLKWLAQNGKITPETMIETEDGKTASARKVKGLTFGETVQAEAKQVNPTPVVPQPAAQAVGIDQIDKWTVGTIVIVSNRVAKNRTNPLVRRNKPTTIFR